MSKNKINEFVNFLASNNDYSNIFLKNMFKKNFDDEEYWEYVLSNSEISDDFIIENFDLINVNYLIKYRKLSTNIINKLIDDDIVNINNLIKSQRLSCDIIQKCIDKQINDIDWNNILENQKLSITILEKYENKWDWDILSLEQFLTIDFLIKYITKINWVIIPCNLSCQCLFNEGFISLFCKLPIWDNIGFIENINIDVMLKYKEYFTEKSWISILENKKLTDNDILEINSYYNTNKFWEIISSEQKLSTDFIDKYSDNLSWFNISLYQKLDIHLLKKYADKINLDNITKNDFLEQETLDYIIENKLLFNGTLDIDFINNFTKLKVSEKIDI
jgi:hypothetical protein